MLVQFCEEYEQMSKDIRHNPEASFNTPVSANCEKRGTLNSCHNIPFLPGAGAVDAVNEASEAGDVVSEVGLWSGQMTRSRRPGLQRLRSVSRPGPLALLSSSQRQGKRSRRLVSRPGLRSP